MRVMECLHDFTSLLFAYPNCHPSVLHAGGGGGSGDMSSILINSQHDTIKLHDLLPFFLFHLSLGESRLLPLCAGSSSCSRE